MMKMKLLGLLTALTVAVCSLAGCSEAPASSAEESKAESSATQESSTADSSEAQSSTEESSAEADAGDKITVNMTLVLEDKTEIPYELKVTKDSNLRQALFEAGLITEEETVAMFVQNIDGHIADALNDGCTWLPCDENGNQIMGMFDDIILSDGQSIQLVYTVVPDYD